MKKVIRILALTFTLILCLTPVDALPVWAFGMGGPARITVVFSGNGGNGAMDNLTVQEGAAAGLPKNAFSRTGFTFTGWNTQADGNGQGFTETADAAQLASEANNGQSIVLYAQWKLNKPKIKKLVKSTPVTFKVAYTKNPGAAGYEIQYSANKNFKKAKTAAAKKGSAKKEITDIVPGKTYNVRMRGFYDNHGVKSYSDWSNLKKIKIKKASTITNTKCEAAIEADVVLTGSGTGYHAKLVVATPLSAVSFGIQYDSYAVAPYTGKAMALVENVASNNAGGQVYTRPGNKQLKLGKTYHMMLTVNKDGTGSVYLDYKKIGGFSNKGLVNQFLYLRVEGSARLNGDRVNARFKNIRCKTGGKYDPGKIWTTSNFDTCPTIKSKVKKDGSISINGHLSGLPAGGDWDNQYGIVSGIRQFIQ